ncbi:protein disabled isoform X2 [Homalodisca vitripennis]|uniref:protein disabled isoform X2 n=1 Tax=Homalodisca vitripennis TaxID=197043 RepID=UPI001EEA1F1B|nr:protein disabled isoform X2 [Homalodisca vitripennis]
MRTLLMLTYRPDLCKDVTKNHTSINKNEPSRFLGEGVSYKAKLIGILEVSDPRGDRMCQEALADLKMAIRAAGEHKQRITINIAIDGLRLRDDKTGDCLYHHPVHKISFIAQDMSDSRAFGYIFGSPDTGHRFFGIKTDKAASQVVISMRDLFQVVFELKKKEIEMAKQHIEQHQIKYGMGIYGDTSKTPSDSVAASSKLRPITEDSGKDNTSKSSSAPPEAIADLLDLEFELNNIQQGLNQMERITPSDPFGDSFAPPSSAKLAPPPTKTIPSPKERHWLERDSQSAETPPPPTKPDKEQHWFDRETEALFDDGELPSSPLSAPPPQTSTTNSTQPTKVVLKEEADLEPNNKTRDQFDVFTELDPLGTGKIKPYIDKKDFFQELKNPPKKVLKDLVGELPKENNPPLFQANFENNSEVVEKPSKESVFPAPAATDPFGDDPFDKTDPFVDSDFSHSVGFAVVPSMNQDPFDTCFADFTNFSDQSDFNATNSFETPIRKSPQPSEGSPPVHGPLRVSLPPEKQSEPLEHGSPKLSPSPPSSRNRNKYSRLHKQNILSGLVKLPSPKQKARSRIIKQNTLDSTYDRSSPVMEGVTLKNRGLETPSPPNVSFLGDLAPEPPPRPAVTSTLIKPPPLPPKRQLQTAVMKPPPRPPHTDEHPHYDYIENCESSGEMPSDVKSPPIPVPARRPRFGGDEISAPHRPSKTNIPSHSEPEYYLTPFPLLPPPQKKSLSPKNSISRDSSVSPRPTPNNAVSSLDITLSQLSKTGFSDLAATLNMSPTSLSKMTLQELTKCLQNLSEVQKNDPSTEEFIQDGDKIRKNVLKSEQYSALRESIDEDTPPFKAEFESHFNPTFENKVSTKEEESLFDKYAVFRELLEQEKTIFDSPLELSTVEETVTSNKYNSESTIPESSDSIINNDSNEEVKMPEPLSKPTVDRYAALRDICLDDLTGSKDTDKEETEPLSDKDDSIAEVTRFEDELDTLTMSRPHSESTDSPTATIKETQSIMESTIMEEDANALDDEEACEEVHGDLGSTLPTVAESNESIAASDSPVQSVPVKEPSVSSLQSLKGENLTNNSKDKEVDFNSLTEGWAKFDNGITEIEKSGSVHSEGNVSPWSVDSKDTSKEPYSPAWHEQPERKSRKGRRHKVPPASDWQEDEESEEGWDSRRSRNASWDEPPRRENGWSDGDSLCDDTPPYDFKHHPQYPNQRRGRRRKVSPWRKSSRDPSSWEEDDRDLSEDQWEEKRWEETSWQTRPKHRGSSWEEERRRDDLRRDDMRREESRRDDSRRDESRREDSRRDDPRRDDSRRDDSRRDDSRRDDSRKRRPSPWSTEGERRSSRESLTWEDDERYPRRNYRDRRRRRWEDGNYSRRDWRDREQGRRNYQYYRDRSHESPWEDEFSEQGDEDSPRCQTRKQMWCRSRNSEDEQYDRRYVRPSSREEQNVGDPDTHWARKSQTLQTRSRVNRNKKRSQNSPFEDDFTSQNFVFASEKSPGAGSDFSDYGSKAVLQKPQSSPDEVFKRKEGFSDGADFSPQDGKVLTPRSRQSPFEDDFTPPETRRANGRSISSDLSEKRIQLEEQKNSDDVFLGDSNNDVVNRPRSSKLDKNVLELSITKRKCKINSDQNLGKLKTESESLSEELASKRSSDKRQGPDLKSRMCNLRRNDSSSIKPDSINIFARSGDPFDDDFFSTDTSSCNLSKNKDEKTKKSDPFKWAEAFSAFNFDEEAK